MTQKNNVFVDIGDLRAAVDAYVASQGLCLSDVPALRAAAKRFAQLTLDESQLPAEKKARIQTARQAESSRVLAKLNDTTPSLKLRRTVSAVVNEALREYLASLENKPDVQAKFQDFSPNPKVLAR